MKRYAQNHTKNCSIVKIWIFFSRGLTYPGGSLLLAGRSGMGRRDAVRLVANLHQLPVFSPPITANFSAKQFHNELKNAIQTSISNGEQSSIFNFDGIEQLRMMEWISVQLMLDERMGNLREIKWKVSCKSRVQPCICRIYITITRDGGRVESASPARPLVEDQVIERFSLKFSKNLENLQSYFRYLQNVQASTASFSSRTINCSIAPSSSPSILF